ncbi:hypothetical protein QYM36_014693 [Artemia franciscana]|uniref:Macro domain-containing protein n=1 Tax=Artemia franciscana TaxID=6661 RepID=A0AA88L3R8_ARTSF|nr:hypothetical protein QYM36_014693 [Artemia franciscana]
MVDTPMVLCGNAWKPLKSWAVYFQQNKEKILSNVPSIPDVNIFRSEKELGKKVALIKGDITKLKVDAVVNAANRPLRGGGGVDGAIHKAAGTQQLLSETKKLYPQGCLPGNAVITKGFNLPAKSKFSIAYIIHTVGPMDKDDETLMSCYHNCFKLCVKHKLRSIQEFQYDKLTVNMQQRKDKHNADTLTNIRLGICEEQHLRCLST